MAGGHVGAEVLAERLGKKNGVEEYCRLSHGGLTEVFVSAGKHEVGDAEAENVVGLFEELTRFGVVVVQVFAHSYELGALAGEYVCFHYGLVYKIS